MRTASPGLEVAALKDLLPTTPRISTEFPESWFTAFGQGFRKDLASIERKPTGICHLGSPVRLVTCLATTTIWDTWTRYKQNQLSPGLIMRTTPFESLSHTTGTLSNLSKSLVQFALHICVVCALVEQIRTAFIGRLEFWRCCDGHRGIGWKC